ncbi:MAG TPA: CAP domain-containing protein [Anseongella sp.]|nr:CAP domain-containing protein [Anseongella sp.]
MLLVTCSEYPGRKAPPVAEVEDQVFQLVNEFRRSKGLSSLRQVAAVRKEAQRHSQNMARGIVPLSHLGFSERIKRIREATGVKGRSGENVAEGYKTALEAVNAWKKSPGHRKHMLGAFDLTGVGVVRARNGKLYFTQIFIASRNTRAAP